jgi:hypothetical protein
VTGVFDAVTSVVAVGLFVEPDPFEAVTVLKVVATGLGVVVIVVAALTFVTSSALATDESKKRNNNRMDDNNRRGR